ncbi:Non-ribosomal peptide synthase protein (TIGR01720 family) (Fragment) OS=Streptomyces griseomycini OX=66895 GN=FHS37_007878 PE=4 SV=1 [Streptomyces griseomycini]
MLDDGAWDAYQMQMAFRVEGEVDPDRMQTAAQALLERHANLRTAFVHDSAGRQVQLVVDGIDVPWQQTDLGHLPEDEREAAFEAFLAEDHARSFDPAAAPMLRLTLVRMAPERSELVLTAHHALFDGWSLPVIMSDLLRLYGSGATPRCCRGCAATSDFLVRLSRQDDEETAAPGRGAGRRRRADPAGAG